MRWSALSAPPRAVAADVPSAFAVSAIAIAPQVIVPLVVAALLLAGLAVRPIGVWRRPVGDGSDDRTPSDVERVDRRDEHVGALIDLLDQIARFVRTGISLPSAVEQSLVVRATCLPGVLGRLRAGSTLHDALCGYDAGESDVGRSHSTRHLDPVDAGDPRDPRDPRGGERRRVSSRRAPPSTSPERLDDDRLVVQTLIACCRSGGQLAVPVERAATVLRERRAWRRERRALSAQARLSAAVMTSLPIGFAVWGTTTSTTVRSAYSASPIVPACTAIGLVLNTAGWWWMRRLVRGERR